MFTTSTQHLRFYVRVVRVQKIRNIPVHIGAKDAWVGGFEYTHRQPRYIAIVTIDFFSDLVILQSETRHEAQYVGNVYLDCSRVYIHMRAHTRKQEHTCHNHLRWYLLFLKYSTKEYAAATTMHRFPQDTYDGKCAMATYNWAKLDTICVKIHVSTSAQ